MVAIVLLNFVLVLSEAFFSLVRVVLLERDPSDNLFIFLIFSVLLTCKRTFRYRDPYVPMSKKNAAESVKKESYVYTAMPITYTKFDRIDTGKDEGNTKSPNESGESKRKKELTADYIVVSSSRQTILSAKLLTTDDTGLDRVTSMPMDASGGGGGNGLKIPGNALAAQSPSTVKPKESTKSSVRSSVSVLATELECALLQVMICRDQDSSFVSGNSGVTSPANEAARYSPLPSKDSGSDITQVHLLPPSMSSFHTP